MFTIHSNNIQNTSKKGRKKQLYVKNLKKILKNKSKLLPLLALIIKGKNNRSALGEKEKEI